MTAVEYLSYAWAVNGIIYQDDIDEALKMEKEQAELYAEFAVLNDRSENPIIPFNEFINIDNL